MALIRNMQNGMKAYKLVTILTILIACCTILSCSKPVNSLETSSPCENSRHATIKNLTGLDGCSWVLVLDNGQKLEPTNLKSFDNIKLEDGKDVMVEYEEQPYAVSICMVGKIIKIICISEL